MECVIIMTNLLWPYLIILCRFFFMWIKMFKYIYLKGLNNNYLIHFHEQWLVSMEPGFTFSLSNLFFSYL